MRKVGGEFLGGHVIKSHRRAFCALVEKVGGGNTSAMNRAATKQALLELALADAPSTDSSRSSSASDLDFELRSEVLQHVLESYCDRQQLPNIYMDFLQVDSSTCYQLFRFEKDDLPLLKRYLRLPDSFTCSVIFFIFSEFFSSSKRSLIFML